MIYVWYIYLIITLEFIQLGTYFFKIKPKKLATEAADFLATRYSRFYKMNKNYKAFLKDKIEKCFVGVEVNNWL